MKRFFAFLCFLLLIAAPVVGQVRTPQPMSPARLVNDFAGLFTAQERAMLERTLVDFADTTSTQIAIVTLSDLDGYTPVEMASGIIDNWGVGQKGLDNGVVILLKPRNDTKGEVFIAVGRGLEGVLNDAKAGRVIDNVMLEPLKRGDYFTAAAAGALEVCGIVSGEFTAKYAEPSWWERNALFIIVLALILILSIFGKKGDGDSNHRGGGFFPWWILLAGGGRGGSGGGGFGGGGFGGFGGGGSAGGGAGRSF